MQPRVVVEGDVRGVVAEASPFSEGERVVNIVEPLDRIVGRRHDQGPSMAKYAMDFVQNRTDGLCRYVLDDLHQIDDVKHTIRIRQRTAILYVNGVFPSEGLAPFDAQA